MRRMTMLCGLYLLMTGAGASGAQLIRSSSTDSAIKTTSVTSRHQLRQKPPMAHSDSEQGYMQRRTVKRTNRAGGTRVILLGEQALESMVDHNLAGTIAAFAFRARRSGTAASINVYLATPDRATTLVAGLYSSSHGQPRSLLTSGLLRSPRAGAWNSVAVRSASLRSGRTYWLAVLGRGGAIYFRDRDGGLCTGERSSRRELRSLPGTWPAGPESHVCHISAYVKGSSGANTKVFGINAPAGTTGPAGGTAAATPTDTTPPTSGTNLTLSPLATLGPVVSGQAVQGQTLTASEGMWSNSPASYGYQWQDCNTGGAGCVNIGGATGSGYTLAGSDVGDTVRVMVTATNSAGSGSAPSSATATVTAASSGGGGSAPSNSGAPVISGTVEPGGTLSVSPGSWTNSPTSYSYQWYDEGEPISGSTGSTYVVQSSDVDHTIDVVVTAMNGAGAGASARSGSTGVVVEPCSMTVSSASQAVADIESTSNAGKAVCLSSGTYSLPSISVNQASMTTLEAEPGASPQPVISNTPSISANNLRIEGFQLADGLSDAGSGNIDIVGNYYANADPGYALWYTSTGDSADSTVQEWHNRMINVEINDSAFEDGWGLSGCSGRSQNIVQEYNTFDEMNQHPLQLLGCASETIIGNEYLNMWDEYTDQHVDCVSVGMKSGPATIEDNRCTTQDPVPACPSSAYGNGHCGSDMILSGDSGPFTIKNNLIANSPKQCFDDTPNGTSSVSMSNGVIENNTVWGCSDGGIDMTGSGTGNTVEFNIAKTIEGNGNCSQFTVADYNALESGGPNCPGTHDVRATPNFASTEPSDTGATYATSNINPAWGYQPALVGYDAHMPTP